MTEIRIEKKKSIWPYLLIGLLILGVIGYLVYTSDIEGISEKVASKNNLSTTQNNNTEVNAYVAFTNNDNQTLTLNHAYFNEALIKLADATGSLAGEHGFDVKNEMDKVKVLAEKIQSDPYAVTHSGDIQNAGVIITAVLSSMQNAKFPGLSTEATEVKRTVAQINPQILTLDQKGVLDAFFRSAAELLQKMN